MHNCIHFDKPELPISSTSGTEGTVNDMQDLESKCTNDDIYSNLVYNGNHLLNPEQMVASTPIDIAILQQELARHPNREFVNHLITGLSQGFETGLSSLPNSSLICKNLLSARSEPEIVDSLVEAEVQKGFVIGPFDSSPFKIMRISPIGVATGKYSGKKRLILDLSAPHDSEDTSINDLINKDDYSLKYVKIDDAIKVIAQLGNYTKMCKVDIADAFKLIPIHPKFLASLWNAVAWKNVLL